MSGLNDYLVRSAAAITAMVERDLTGEMERATSAVVTALSSGKALLIAGNGGSASDAIHIAGELVGRFLKERKAYNVIALPANAAVLTAWGNDYGFDTVFSRQVEAHGRPGSGKVSGRHRSASRSSGIGAAVKLLKKRLRNAV